MVFLAHRGNDNARRLGGRATTLADGSFTVAGLPRAGYVAVQSPIADYILREIGNTEFFEGQPGGFRLYSHAFIACDPKPGGTAPEMGITLRRGVTVTGHIVRLTINWFLMPGSSAGLRSDRLPPHGIAGGVTITAMHAMAASSCTGSTLIIPSWSTSSSLSSSSAQP